MGRITEYQRQRLASSAVGVAEPSRAGQIIGQALVEFGGVVQRREQEEIRQQNALSDLQANNALMQWSFGFEKLAQGLQMEYASDPEKYPDRLQEEAIKLTDETAQYLQNDAVRVKFITGATTAIRGSAKNAYSWVSAKRKANGQVDIDNALNAAVLRAGTNADVNSLVLAVNGIYDTMYTLQGQSEAERMNVDGLTEAERQNKTNKFLTYALSGHIAARIETEPENVLKDLNDGIYDNLQVPIDSENKNLRVPLREDKKRQYIEQAKKGVDRFNKVQEERKKLERLSSLKFLTERVQNNKLNTVEIDRFVEQGTITVQDSIVFKDILDTVIPVQGKQTDAKFTQKAESWVNVIENAVKNPDMVDTLLQKAVEAYHSGKGAEKLTAVELNSILKYYSNNLEGDTPDTGFLKRLLTYSGVGAVSPGILGYVASKDIMGALTPQKQVAFPKREGEISVPLDAFVGGVPDNELKAEAINHAYSATFKKIAEGREPDSAAIEAIEEAKDIMYPIRKQYKIGAVVQSPDGGMYEIVGYAQDGEPLLEKR